MNTSQNPAHTNTKELLPEQQFEQMMQTKDGVPTEMPTLFNPEQGEVTPAGFVVINGLKDLGSAKVSPKRRDDIAQTLAPLVENSAAKKAVRRLIGTMKEDDSLGEDDKLLASSGFRRLKSHHSRDDVALQPPRKIKAPQKETKQPLFTRKDKPSKAEKLLNRITQPETEETYAVTETARFLQGRIAKTPHKLFDQDYDMIRETIGEEMVMNAVDVAIAQSLDKRAERTTYNSPIEKNKLQESYREWLELAVQISFRDEDGFRQQDFYQIAEKQIAHLNQALLLNASSDKAVEQMVKSNLEDLRYVSAFYAKQSTKLSHEHPEAYKPLMKILVDSSKDLPTRCKSKSRNIFARRTSPPARRGIQVLAHTSY